MNNQAKCSSSCVIMLTEKKSTRKWKPTNSKRGWLALRLVFDLTINVCMTNAETKDRLCKMQIKRTKCEQSAYFTLFSSGFHYSQPCRSPYVNFEIVFPHRMRFRVPRSNRCIYNECSTAMNKLTVKSVVGWKGCGSQGEGGRVGAAKSCSLLTDRYPHRT